MRILAIETSCDETGISIIDASGTIENGDVQFSVLANELSSQAKLHSEYGGVYPTLAKREHIKALPILLERALSQIQKPNFQFSLPRRQVGIFNLKTIFNLLISKFKKHQTPTKSCDISQQNQHGIDAIAVTHGPGLEPALWTGITFAENLAKKWGVPLVPINHMEGHIFSALMHTEDNLKFVI